MESIAFTYPQSDVNVQVNGYCLIFDMTGVGTKQMSRYSSSDVRKWYSYWQVSNMSELQSTSRHRVSYHVASSEEGDTAGLYSGVVPERGGTPLRQIVWSRNGAPVNVVGHRRNAESVAFQQIS